MKGRTTLESLQLANKVIKEQNEAYKFVLNDMIQKIKK
jgi:hypothetical protein